MLIRGMRNFSAIYERNFAVVSDTEEIIRDEAIIDFIGKDCQEEFQQDCPQEIFLRASVNPIPIDIPVVLLRNEGSRQLTIGDIYDAEFRKSSEKFHFCKAVSITYEGSGYFSHENASTAETSGDEIQFTDKQVGQYNLEFISDFPDELFRMTFHTCESSPLRENLKDARIVLESGETIDHLFYPYGGCYFYGCHLKQIEPFVCRAVTDLGALKIVPYSLSSLIGREIYLMTNVRNCEKMKISSPITLYDSIKNGDCRIKLISEDNSLIFKSNLVFQTQNTNLIVIRFTRE